MNIERGVATMKKITRSDIMQDPRPVVILPYSMGEWLTAGFEKVGYNAGVYGWNYSAYAGEGILWVFGYRVPTFKRCRLYDAARGKALRGLTAGASWGFTSEELIDSMVKAVRDIERRRAG